MVPRQAVRHYIRQQYAHGRLNDLSANVPTSKRICEIFGLGTGYVQTLRAQMNREFPFWVANGGQCPNTGTLLPSGILPAAGAHQNDAQVTPAPQGVAAGAGVLQVLVMPPAPILAAPAVASRANAAPQAAAAVAVPIPVQQGKYFFFYWYLPFFLRKFTFPFSSHWAPIIFII